MGDYGKIYKHPITTKEANMILTDYFRAKPDSTWDMAIQCGVKTGTIRLPEDSDFDVTSLEHLKTVADRFQSHGIKPIIVEPLPNELHDHIKLGDEYRDECIEKFIKLMANLKEVGIGTVCFNFMAHYGWTRTGSDYPERGGAKVTGFELSKFKPDGFTISAEKMWDNYEYFVRAAVPYAEKYGIKLALHPDDPPMADFFGVARIMTSYENILRAVNTVDSPNLGVTFCQACYHLMGADLNVAIPELAKKIFFVHFRNVKGDKTNFRETFHDNGELEMAKIMKLYVDNGVNAPVRVDHVPTLLGEDSVNAGYDALGRLYAIGYLRGILESLGACHE